jgi:hypothetical protein
MTVSRENLIKNFVSNMEEGDAALFIGAGMSRPSGFVDWKGLLRECAKELNLDLDREHDLVAVAQYYLNLRNRDRSRLNQIISEEFRKPAALSINHEIIARLPVSTIWTMNFDSLIEDALRANGRIVDVKSRDQDVALHLKDRDTVLYKMHGDINRPDEVIICKDDYERYAKSHYILQHALEGDLISKTFLFLGFSFSDPNLDYMLGHLRSLLEESKREHYAIMRKARLDFSKVNKDKEEAYKTFEYEKNKQQLQINDLQRYSIQTYLVEKFSEITGILEDIEKTYLMKNVFVSGSAINFGELGEERIRDLCMHLGERIVDEDYRLVSGVGLNIGDSVVKGSLLRLYEKGVSSIEKKLTVRPFPRNLPPGVNEAEFNQTYRESMIKKCGFAIFISGNSRTAPEMSRGILEEFAIASKLNKIPIPIGATGFAARHIWEKIEPDIDTVYSGQVPHHLFQKLNDPGLGNSELLDTVFTIMRTFRNI